MKIIYLHQHFKFPNESGGTRSYDLAMGFIASGHEVDVITSTNSEIYKTKQRWVKIVKDGLSVYYVYLPYGNQFSYAKRSLVFINFLWLSTLKLLSLRADVVLATSTPLTIGVPALLKKWIHKTPFVFETRDVWPEAVIAIGAIKNKLLQKILFKLEEVIYKYADAIVPLSVDMKNSITSRYPKLINKPIEIIENISEINRFQNNWDSNLSVLTKMIGFQPRFPILYAGTFGKVNGIEYALNIAEKSIDIDPTIVLVLIGDGAEKSLLFEKAIEKNILNKNVFFVDAVSKQELPQLYFECAMGSSFVISIKELWANSANKFFDTLAAGKPILINHQGWQADVILSKNIGFVLPDKLNDAAIKAFVEYTQNEDLHKKQQENALKVARENYSLDIALSKYDKIFNKIESK
jgi:glycosyltransferase involved in cell wall biosynthesis